MGVLFTLDTATKAVIQQGLDDLITELGKDCLIVYPPLRVNCVNCVKDPIGNKSSNVWKTGGPLPFPNGGICPMCNGSFTVAKENSETLHLLCAWEPRNFFYPIRNLDLKVPFGTIQTKGYMSDLPKIKRANYLVFELPIVPIIRQTYVLSGEPGDQSNIIQNRYFVATWERKNV